MQRRLFSMGQHVAKFNFDGEDPEIIELSSDDDEVAPPMEIVDRVPIDTHNNKEYADEEEFIIIDDYPEEAERVSSVDMGSMDSDCEIIPAKEPPVAERASSHEEVVETAPEVPSTSMPSNSVPTPTYNYCNPGQFPPNLGNLPNMGFPPSQLGNVAPNPIFLASGHYLNLMANTMCPNVLPLPKRSTSLPYYRFDNKTSSIISMVDPSVIPDQYVVDNRPSHVTVVSLIKCIIKVPDLWFPHTIRENRPDIQEKWTLIAAAMGCSPTWTVQKYIRLWLDLFTSFYNNRGDPNWLFYDDMKVFLPYLPPYQPLERPCQMEDILSNKTTRIGLQHQENVKESVPTARPSSAMT